jgi:hypothetical protein
MAALARTSPEGAVGGAEPGDCACAADAKAVAPRRALSSMDRIVVSILDMGVCLTIS